MKITALTYCITLAFALPSCGEKPYKKAKTNATIEVTDIEGKVLPDVLVGGTYYEKFANTQGFGSAEMKSSTARTNYYGLAALSNETESSFVHFGIREAPGYYKHFSQEYRYTSQSKGVWQPDNPLIQFKLKPIKNPIPLYAKRAIIKLPLENTWLGYDFEKADLVSPHGKGVITDVEFYLLSRYARREDQESKLKIRFPHLMDGLLQMEIDALNKGSELIMPYHAPENGYLQELEKTKFVNPKELMLHTNVSDRNFYFLRVRSKIDANKNLVSANYVKIHNDFRYDAMPAHPKVVYITYYFNPTPNDRNLEFDMTKNLFSNLKDDEKPLSP